MLIQDAVHGLTPEQDRQYLQAVSDFVMKEE